MTDNLDKSLEAFTTKVDAFTQHVETSTLEHRTKPKLGWFKRLFGRFAK